MKTQDFRKYFPGLEQYTYGKKLVYLDNAATSQRSSGVLSLSSELAEKSNANVHRAVYDLANRATSVLESTRDYVKEYLNAKYREEIIFTSGTTFSINLVAHSYGDVLVNEGDNVIVGESEHHSNLVPWQLLASRKKAEIRVLPIKKNGMYDTDRLSNLIDDRTKLVCVAQVSNVLGVVNPVSNIIKIAHEKGVRVLVDGAQGAVHQRVDVQKLDCDFYAFSGHKLYAATGTGVLYAKKILLDQMEPFLGGGEMIESVSFEKTTYASLPYKFEAGTPNFNYLPTLKPALSLLEFCFNDEELQKNFREINRYVHDALSSDERIVLAGGSCPIEYRIPLFSFYVKGVHHEDLATIMDKMGVELRSGHMCAEPLMRHYCVSGMLRASFALYNTLEEAEYFISSLNKAINILK